MVEAEAAVTQFERLKVFVSYSRTDLDFADQLVLALEDKGFEALVDRHDIDAAEKWKDRLGALIASSDTVVFVLSEKSAGSPICGWEVEEAARLGKRIIPVVPHDPSGVAPPPQLSELNYIHFFKHPNVPGSGFYDGVQKLDRALRVNLGWLRRQTAYAEQAAAWAADKSDDRVLSGKPLEEAIAWRASAPAGTTVSALVLEYLAVGEAVAARRKAEADANIADREAALKRARRATTIGFATAVVLIVFAGLLSVAASRATHAAGVNRAEIFATESDRRAEGERYAQAILIALAGDPSARQGGWVERTFFANEGYPSVRDALVGAMTQNRLLRDYWGDQDALFTDVALAPDGRVAAFVNEGEVRVWSSEGVELMRFNAGNNFGAFSADGRRLLVTGGRQYTLWDVERGEVVRTFDGESFMSLDSTLSPDGSRIVGISSDAVQLFDADTAQVLWSFRRPDFEGRRSQLIADAFSRDGQWLLLAFEREITLLDAETGRLLKRYAIPNGEGTRTLAFAPSGRRAVFAFDQSFQIVDLDTDTRTQLSFAVESATFASEGRLLTTLEDGAIYDWVEANNWASRLRVPAMYGGDKLRTSPDGTALLTGVARLWSIRQEAPGETLENDRSLPEWPLYDHWSRRFTGHIVYAPDGDHELRSQDDTLVIADSRTDQIVQRLSDSDASDAIAYSTDGARVAGQAKNGDVVVWDSQEGSVLHRIRVPDASIWRLAFSPDGHTLLVGTNLGAYVWVFGAASAPTPIGPRSGTYGFAFSPDGRQVLIGAGEGGRLFDVATRELVRRLTVTASAVAMSRDGQYALTVRLGRVTMWNVRTGRALQIFETPPPARPSGNPNGDITAVGFTSDGRHVLVASFGSPMRRYDIDPLVFASPDDQVRAGCATLRRMGMTRYSDSDLDQFPILRPPALRDPCAGVR